MMNHQSRDDGYDPEAFPAAQRAVSLLASVLVISAILLQAVAAAV